MDVLQRFVFYTFPVCIAKLTCGFCSDVDAKVKLLATALLELGLKENSRLGIYCNTRFEWQLIAQACFRTNITVVTVYANLGEEGLAYALEQGK